MSLQIGEKEKLYIEKVKNEHFNLKGSSWTGFDFIFWGIYSFTNDSLNVISHLFKILRFIYRSLVALFTRVVYTIYSVEVQNKLCEKVYHL